MSILKEIQAEIVRVSRREIKKQLEPIRSVNANQRMLIAKLRKQVVVLEKEVKALRKNQDAEEKVPEVNERGHWITGKGIKSLRKRLGITQLELAKLVGVTGQTVVNWEGTEKKIDVRRKETQERLVEIRSMGKREVDEALGKSTKIAIRQNS